MKKNPIIILCLLIFPIILPAQDKETKKQNKKALRIAQYEQAKQVLESRQFEFEAYWLRTSQGRLRQVDRGQSYLIIEPDMVRAYLPYFGIARSSTVFSGGGISFAGEAEDFRMTAKDNKKRISISFTIEDQGERFDVWIRSGKGLSATVDIMSSRRDRISYDGVIKSTEQ